MMRITRCSIVYTKMLIVAKVEPATMTYFPPKMGIHRIIRPNTLAFRQPFHTHSLGHFVSFQFDVS